MLAYLRSILGSLNPADRRVADEILADPEKIITTAIAQLRSRSEASVGSIVGFCRRLGFEGFAAFKLALAQDLAQSGLPAARDLQSGSLLAQVLQFHTQSLAETLQINRTVDFARVSRALENAQRIEFFSIGISYPVAYTAYCKFALLGLPASTEADAHMQLIKATQMGTGDVAFGISCSGTTRETVQCLEVAKSHGATTICITNAMKSPITTASDHALYATPSEIKYFQAPLASRITQLALIDALFVSLAQRHKNRTASRLQQASEHLYHRALT